METLTKSLEPGSMQRATELLVTRPKPPSLLSTGTADRVRAWACTALDSAPRSNHQSCTYGSCCFQETVTILEVSVNNHCSLEVVDLVPSVIPVRHPITTKDNGIATLDNVSVRLPDLVVHLVRSQSGGTANRATGKCPSARNR